MRLVPAKSKTLLEDAAGIVNVPASLYLNLQHNNPHTHESVAAALRVFIALLDAFAINLGERALKGECLREGEKAALKQLVYRPVDEIELMSPQMVRRVATATSDLLPEDAKDANQPNTAAKRLRQIADWLHWYHKKVLGPRLPLGSTLSEALRRQYDDCVEELKNAIRGTQAANPFTIRSAPKSVFLEIYRTVFLDPEKVFLSASGKPSPTLMRDRAIVLLAADSVRPGAIGNIARTDFSWAGGPTKASLILKDHTAKRKRRITTGTPKQKGARSTKQPYNSNITIQLTPCTSEAIQDYIEGEREALLEKTIKNKSLGFLLLAEHGGPIADRGTISAVFRRARQGLTRLGLLAVPSSDPYTTQSRYDLSAYLLRHSSASLFYAEKQDEPDVKDQMRNRFGWTDASTMPNRYALRAISDAASTTTNSFYESLQQARKAKMNS